MSSICNDFVAVNKEFNIKRFHDTKHTNFSNFTGQTRKKKFNQFRTILKKQSSVFQRQTTELKNITLTSH